MALSVFAIKAAEIRDKQYKLSDADGLYLLVTPKGGKCWRMNYRHAGKQRTLSFGVFPDTGLAEARAQRDAARKALARGEDPAERARIAAVFSSIAGRSANISFSSADENVRRAADPTDGATDAADRGVSVPAPKGVDRPAAILDAVGAAA